MGSDDESTCPVKAKQDKEAKLKESLSNEAGIGFSGDSLGKQLEFAWKKIDEAYAKGRMNENTRDDFRANLLSIKDSQEGDDVRTLKIGQLIGSVLNQ